MRHPRTIRQAPEVFAHKALRRLWVFLFGCVGLSGQVLPLQGQDRGNTTAQEYGDAVYRELGGTAGFLGYDYNHAGVFGGTDSGHNGKVLQAFGSDTTTHEAYFFDEFPSFGTYYYGAYTLNNRTMTFTDRRNVVTTAIGLVNAAIPYPSTFLQIPVCIVYYGGGFDGTISDISNIRCDGFVEYCYEKNNFRVWHNQVYVDSAWSIALYPDLNNDRPDNTRNPEDEASPWAQRGAPCATGPVPGLGCSYLAPDTKMTTPAIITLPTYQVTTNGGPGYIDVTIQATDASGIHLVAVVKPGEANWTYSPTQSQHPTSASYSWTTRITNSGTLYYAAIDNGGNAPTVAQTPSVNLMVPQPSVPTAIAATSVTNSGFTANWNGASGATGYRLDVSTSSTFVGYVSGYQNFDVGNMTSTSVTGLVANTAHYYRVRAYNSGGTSGNSGTISATTLPNPPPAPTANAATSVTNSGFNANWSSASGATGYRLDVSSNNAFSDYVSGYQDLDMGSATTKSVSGLSAGVTYYYRVRAYNSGGAGGNSGTITVLLVPAAPIANVASEVTSTAFMANWNSVTGTTGYRLDVSTNGAFANFVSGYQNLDVGNVIVRNVTSLSASAVYYYRVRAYNGSGTSTNSGTIAVTTIAPSLAFIRQGSNLVLSWPTNASLFKLYYATNLSTATWISNPVSPPIVSGQYTITNSMTNNARFYRLKK